MIKIIEKKCPQNHLCPLILKCPAKAITQKGYNAPKIDKSKCINCLICVNNCPYACFENE